MKKVLFIDRDGTLVIEPPVDYQLDSLKKLEFYPGAFRYLSMIAEQFNYELVMVTNQDGLGTESFPEDTFWPAQEKIIQAFENEGVVFADVHIDRTFPEQNAPTRKPGTAMLTRYLKGDYDLTRSFVLGDRFSDVKLAENLGCKAIWMNESESESNQALALQTTSWKAIYQFLLRQNREAQVYRNTNETRIGVRLDLDGSGESRIDTGLNFFDHMLDQLARHGGCDLDIDVKGDLEVDEHHTIEDTAIALGETFAQALGKKVGIERYGFCLPMDDALAQVAIDFGGRPWLEWEVSFDRSYVGDVPVEMWSHFFRSFADAARCNLNISAGGNNDHHKIESVFKAFARAIKEAKSRSTDRMVLPSTKGVI